MMAIDIRLTWNGQHFIPADAISAEEACAIAKGSTVAAKLTRPRNLAHHNKFWTLMAVVFDAQAEPRRFPTIDLMVKEIKRGAGLYETYMLNGREVIEIGSIAFHKMDQRAFEQFYDRVVEIVLTAILPGVRRPDLEARIMDIIQDNRRAA